MPRDPQCGSKRRFLLVPMLVCLVLAIVLTLGVLTNALSFVDEYLFLLLRKTGEIAEPVGPAWMKDSAIEITALGGYPVIIVLTLGLSGLLLMRKRWLPMVFLLSSVGGGALVSSIMKAAFSRPRPALIEGLVGVHTTSFPSGHAMMSIVTYLTLALLLSAMPTTRAQRTYCVLVSLVIGFLVGLSRVYLGVHWPSDVIAGWLIGGMWTLAIWQLFLRYPDSSSHRESR